MRLQALVRTLHLTLQNIENKDINENKHGRLRGRSKPEAERRLELTQNSAWRVVFVSQCATATLAFRMDTVWGMWVWTQEGDWNGEESGEGIQVLT